MPAVALISDLVMQSQVSGAAVRAGVSLRIAGSGDALLAQAESVRPRLVILDLSHPTIDPGQFVPRLKSIIPAGGTVLAFGPHVHKGLLSAAADAGCDLVISRGQFHAQMQEILERFAG
ncbi:MAG: response regulator transcription factor [Planctomycetia bacterium]|nr:response regulator transcription factor [Planctomycetia bacterium]